MQSTLKGGVIAPHTRITRFGIFAAALFAINGCGLRENEHKLRSLWRNSLDSLPLVSKRISELRPFLGLVRHDDSIIITRYDENGNSLQRCSLVSSKLNDGACGISAEGWMFNTLRGDTVQMVWVYIDGHVEWMLKPGMFVGYFPDGRTPCNKSTGLCEKVADDVWLVIDFGRSNL